MNISEERPTTPVRAKLYDIIFLADTRAGRWFDLLLIWGILFSVGLVILDSVPRYHRVYGKEIILLEWVFTVIFTIEYLLRLYSVRHPRHYVFSYFGVVDLISIAPMYVGLFVPTAHGFMIIRMLRVLRIFRILKLTQYLRESKTLADALIASRRKIGVFLFVVLVLLTITGSLMYLIEGEENGFTDIPTSIYWSIVTMTTVGYGDISPQTSLGRFAASLVMILGYSVIAVPTGIVTAELSHSQTTGRFTCSRCANHRNDNDARFCKLCGNCLFEPKDPPPNPTPPLE
ncbi:MAG: ion transporter [Zavarzinella sp.]